ncbi:MAG: hypothetical protein ACTSUF_09650 [Candidatus Heimdallarchaeaceae archaeon]
MWRPILGGALLTVGFLRFLKIFVLLAGEDLFMTFLGAKIGISYASVFIVFGFALIFWYAKEKRWI